MNFAFHTIQLSVLNLIILALKVLHQNVLDLPRAIVAFCVIPLHLLDIEALKVIRVVYWNLKCLCLLGLIFEELNLGHLCIRCQAVPV